jgi:alpha-D-xyloside xylohydrolase
MFGSKYLVVPVLEPGQRTVKVYLPAGASWKLWDEKDVVYEGGRDVEIECPIENMPVFCRQ